MTTPDLSKMTKDELLRLAAKNKITVKKTLLKSEIVAVLKKELKKATPKKVKPRAEKAPLKKPAVKSGRATAKAAKRAEKPVTAAKPKAQKTAVKTKEKEVAKKTTPAPKPKPVTAKAKTTTAPAKPKATSKKKAPATRKKSARSSASPSGQQTIPGSGTQSLHPKFELEDSAQEAKFIIGKPDMHDESHAEAYQDLPDNYGDNKLVLLVRDPYWCFLYWELQSENIQSGLSRLNRSGNEVRYVLRIHSPSTGGTYFDTDVDFRAGSHYIQLSPPGASFYSEIGLLDHEGRFAALAVSNTVTLPLDGPSEIIDEQWMTTTENFEEIYALSGGRTGEGLNPLGASETMSARQQMDFSSPAVSSFGSGEIHPPPEKSFNYWLDAELVLFGGADPGATIKLSGENLDLRPDGTFTARFGLPEGTLNLPVTFESPDRSEVHTVAPIINRKTVDKQKEVEQ